MDRTHYSSQTGRPRALLQRKHAPTVRALLARHPALSLRKLCPLVQDELQLSSMNEATLHRFLLVHRIERAMPKGMAQRSARLHDQDASA